jgi:hypothetical protein
MVSMMTPMQKIAEEIIKVFLRPSLSATGHTRRHDTKAPACWRPTAREFTRVAWALEYRKSLTKDARVKTPPTIPLSYLKRNPPKHTTHPSQYARIFPSVEFFILKMAYMCLSNGKKYKEEMSLAHFPATILKYLGRHHGGTLTSQLHTGELETTQEPLDIAS